MNNSNNKSNVFAIVGFVCSLVVGSITGIIFSIIGLTKVSETGKGKGLALAGIIISVVRLVGIIIIGTMFSQLIWPSMKEDILTNAYCSEAYSCSEMNSGELACKYYDGTKENSIICPSSYANKNSSNSNRKETTTSRPIERTTVTTTEPTTTTAEKNSGEKEPINIYVFYGQGCPHCEDLFDYLDNLSNDKEYGNMYKVVKYETWYNSKNADLMQKVYNHFGITNVEEMGVPFYVIGNEHFVGFPSDKANQTKTGNKIKSAIKTAYNDSKYKDIVSSIK